MVPKFGLDNVQLNKHYGFLWSRFEENEIGIPFPQRQVYPMEWPPSKQQTIATGHPQDQHLLREDQDEGSQIEPQKS